MPTAMQELTVLCSLLYDVRGTIAAPYHGWRLDIIADLLDVSRATLIRAIRETSGIEADTPPSVRIDRLMMALNASSATPPGGWSTQALADMAGVHQSAIQARLNSALRHLRAELVERE